MPSNFQLWWPWLLNFWPHHNITMYSVAVENLNSMAFQAFTIELQEAGIWLQCIMSPISHVYYWKVHVTLSVASTRVQGWGDFEAPKGVGFGDGTVPLHRNFVYDLEIAYFGEFWGDKFKVCNYIGGYSHWRPTRPKYWWGCIPASPAALTPVKVMQARDCRWQANGNW